MGQFPDVKKAVNAIQEILNTPYGPHIRSYLSTSFLYTVFLTANPECIELLDDHRMFIPLNRVFAQPYDPQ